MSFQLLETVVLVRDLPEHSLRAGDLGVIAEMHEPDGFDVEFVTASGHTTALVTLASGDIRAVADTDLTPLSSGLQLPARLP
jgi:hypothetical protein